MWKEIGAAVIGAQKAHQAARTVKGSGQRIAQGINAFNQPSKAAPKQKKMPPKPKYAPKPTAQKTLASRFKQVKSVAQKPTKQTPKPAQSQKVAGRTSSGKIKK